MYKKNISDKISIVTSLMSSYFLQKVKHLLGFFLLLCFFCFLFLFIEICDLLSKTVLNSLSIENFNADEEGNNDSELSDRVPFDDFLLFYYVAYLKCI